VGTEREDALEELRSECAPDQLPTLDDSELEKILDKHIRVKTWTANTFFRVGTIVYPTVRTGTKYRVIRAGTTGATEPGWSTVDGSTISSGSVTFDSDGDEFLSIYDMRAAKEAAWIRKAGKATRFMKTGGMDMSAIQKNCLEMAKQFETPLLGG
jgi:hypothetical protein